MQEINERIVYLLYRRLKGLPLTVQENQDLETWLAQSESNRRVYKDFLDEAWFREAEKVYDYTGKEAGLKQLREQIFAGKAPVRTRTVIAKYAVAASILALVSIAGYKFLQTPSMPSQQVAANEVKNQLQIDPGGEAILTLSHGIPIILHEAADGVLAKLGNGGQLIKQDGKLVYPSARTHSTAGPAVTSASHRSDQYSVMLPDGSQVWLNRGSKLTYPEAFTGSVRTIELQGEAYFEVAPMKRGTEKMPFIVKVASEKPGEEPYQVEVLGTHFNIRAHKGEEIRTTLAEGSVRVKKGAYQALLKPNEQAVLDVNNTRLNVKKDISVADVLAWRENKFLFRGESIVTVMEELKRWYGKEYIISGKITRLISITSDRTRPLSQVLTEMQNNGQAHFEEKEDHIVVRP